mgnify:FL=1
MKNFFLNLGKQPLANKYLKTFKKNQIKYDLKLYFDTKSKLVSISKRIPSKVMFNDEYPYRSSMSKTMQKSFNELSKKIKKKFKPRLILEIGSNDGVLIKNFQKKSVIGVEPCKNLAQFTIKKGFKIYDSYWTRKLSKKIKYNHGEFDLIYSANTLTHISNLKDVFSSISYILSDNGVLIVEDPSLLECIKKNSYDQFYNEHIYLFSAISVSLFLKPFNLAIFDIKNLDIHGGSLRYYIKKVTNKKLTISNNVSKQIKKEKKFGLNKLSTYKKFANKAYVSKNKLLKILNELKNENKKIIGYGATAKAVTILNFCNIDCHLIQNFVDTTPEKINRYMPGKNIKIIKYQPDILKNVDYAFLGAWNFKKEILLKEKKFLKKGGKFITHIPLPRIF